MYDEHIEARWYENGQIREYIKSTTVNGKLEVQTVPKLAGNPISPTDAFTGSWGMKIATAIATHPSVSWELEFRDAVTGGYIPLVDAGGVPIQISPIQLNTGYLFQKYGAAPAESWVEWRTAQLHLADIADINADRLSARITCFSTDPAVLGGLATVAVGACLQNETVGEEEAAFFRTLRLNATIPVLFDIRPNSGAAGSSFTMTATGENFAPNLLALAGSTPLVVQFVSSTEVQLVVPASMQPGVYPVYLFYDEASGGQGGGQVRFLTIS